jgi:cell division protein FtsW
MNWLTSRIKGDIYIWLIVFILSAFSLLAVYSSTGSLAYKKQAGNTEYYLIKQLMMILGGLFLMYQAHRINYIYYSRIGQLLMIISIPLLILTFAMGPSINEARRWLTLPGTTITIQTSDLAKLGLIMYLARVLSKNQDKINDFRQVFLPMGIATFLICGLILPSNFSTAALLFASAFIVMFIGRTPLKYLGAMVGVIVVSLGLLILVAQTFDIKAFRWETWQSRVENYMNPGDNPDGSYQSTQAKIAIAKGGIFGKMPGNSNQKNFLPNPFSDFIYAIIIEEYGLLGGIFIMLLYLVLLYRAILIVINSPRAFGALLAMGLTLSLVFQAFVHMGINTGIFPVTGLNLPLISMGGTSILFTSISFGIILSVSRNIEENKEAEKLLART